MWQKCHYQKFKPKDFSVGFTFCLWVFRFLQWGDWGTCSSGIWPDISGPPHYLEMSGTIYQWCDIISLDTSVWLIWNVTKPKRLVQLVRIKFLYIFICLNRTQRQASFQQPGSSTKINTDTSLENELCNRFIEDVF